MGPFVMVRTGRVYQHLFMLQANFVKIK